MPKRQRDPSISTMVSSLPMSTTTTPPQPCPEAIRVWAAASGNTTDSALVREIRPQTSHLVDCVESCPSRNTCVETCPSRKKRKKRMRSIEDIMSDDRSFLPAGIDRLLGRKVPVMSTDGSDLSWTLLKSDLQDNKLHNLKLHQSLEVMHQCFQPSKDPVTHKDLAEDVIFNAERGFYTVVLEKEDKVVTAANVKVHGEVAEVPLVATRFEFRRQGMLKALISEIENWLRDFGIERLVLPSAKSALKTWTSSSIGFSTMSVEEKAELLIAYDCLDFQDTTMCEKQLLKKKKKSQKNQKSGYSSDGSTISHEEYIYVD